MTSSEDPRVRRARKRARGLGLTLRRQGSLFTLLDRSTVLVSGGLSAVEGYLAAHERRGGFPALTSPWDEQIGPYLLHLAAAGQTAPTIELRRAHLSQIARGVQRPVAELTTDELIGWFGRQTHWRPATRRSYRSGVRGFLMWAGRIELAAALPAVRVPPAVPQPVPDSIWREALAAAGPRTRLAMRLAAEAGLRRAEIAQVSTTDLLDSHSGAQLVVHGKGGKVRIVPITESLAVEIRRGPGGHTPSAPQSEWLFPSQRGGHINAATVGQLLSDVLPEGFSAHKLRHRFATRAYRGSRNLRAVQTLLGHASVATTERYTAVDDDEVRAAMLAASQ